MRLQGKVAIVTGAGGGIGMAICRRFAAEGAALIGVDVDAAALASMATSVRAAGARVETLVADVAEEATAEAAVACARREFGALDVLVSNAVCDVPLGPLTGLTLADLRPSCKARRWIEVPSRCRARDQNGCDFPRARVDLSRLGTSLAAAGGLATCGRASRFRTIKGCPKDRRVPPC